MQSRRALDAGGGEHKPDPDFAEDRGLPRALNALRVLRREYDRYEEQEELWQVAHVRA